MTPIRRFRDTFAILMNLDRDELIAAGVLRPDINGKPAEGGTDWARFNRDIGMFVLKLDDPKLQALFDLVQSRLPHDSKSGDFK